MKRKKKLTIVISLIVLASLLVLFVGYAIGCMIAARTMKDTGLPRIDVITENGAQILSKETYVNCTVSISGADDEFCFDSAEAGIRGRGNDTWNYYPKKPYRIKFTEKTSVFGEDKHKSWVLLALYNDFSLIKDRLAFAMAESLGTDGFVPSHHYVELYLNGSYQGIYLLTDQIDEDRLGVKEKFSETDVEVPFFVELDARAPEEGVEGVDWFSVAGRPYAIKYPEVDERYTEEQFQYIRDYIQQVDDLCRKENVTLAELEELIDMESFMDYYLVEEAMGQPEINWKSVYMSREVGGKLKMGPVWDFDWSAMGPSTGKYKNQYREQYGDFRSVDNWFAALYKGSPEFREALALRWETVRPRILSAIDEVEAEKPMLERAARRDILKWHWYRFRGGFDAYSDEVLEWCRNRVEWMDSEIGKN